jgi:hypothetical protein
MALSKRQFAANRANAKKSTGPRSEAGKEKVSQNAVQHALTARFQVLEGESQERFDNLFTQLIKDEQAVGAAEVELVRTMAEHIWCSRRASRIQESWFLVARRPELTANEQPRKRATRRSMNCTWRSAASASIRKKVTQFSAEPLPPTKSRRFLRLRKAKWRPESPPARALKLEVYESAGKPEQTAHPSQLTLQSQS